MFLVRGCHLSKRNEVMVRGDGVAGCVDEIGKGEELWWYRKGKVEDVNRSSSRAASWRSTEKYSKAKSKPEPDGKLDSQQYAAANLIHLHTWPRWIGPQSVHVWHHSWSHYPARAYLELYRHCARLRSRASDFSTIKIRIRPKMRKICMVANNKKLSQQLFGDSSSWKKGASPSGYESDYNQLRTVSHEQRWKLGLYVCKTQRRRYQWQREKWTVSAFWYWRWYWSADWLWTWN